MLVIVRICGVFVVIGGFERRKNKPNQSQSPAFGRKSEARIQKSDNSGAFTGCLLPRVGRQTSWMDAIWKNKSNFRSKKRQNNEKNRWKRVENDEKLSLIWKNKPNLPAAEMNVYVYMIRVYEDFCDFVQRKNKPNSKPNKANFETARMWRGGEKSPCLLFIDNVFVAVFFIDFGR